MNTALRQSFGIASRPISASAGIGLRPPHHSWVIEHRPRVPWFEVHAENFMAHVVLLSELDSIASEYPVSLHCVGLSLGSVTLPESTHLHRLRELVARYSPGLISDHLAWNAVDGIHLPDLLPLPYTEEALRVVIRNVSHVQDVLQRQILLENPSRYVRLPESTLSEPEFLAEVVLRTGCGVLLDVNNLYVSARNQEVDPTQTLAHFLDTVSTESIREVHLAGHSILDRAPCRSMLLDDHGSRISPEVWALYSAAVGAVGPVPTLIEWDTRIPVFNVLEEEASIAHSLMLEVVDGDANHVVAA
jgi:uncharacterized protein